MPVTALMPVGDQPAHLSHMRIADWPLSERPREKLLDHGPGKLSDAELLAIFVGSGARGSDAVTASRALLDEHGSLRDLLDREPGDLARLRGVGPVRACKLSAALELGRRHLETNLERGAMVTDAQAAGRYFATRLRPRKREVFAALFLYNRHCALAFEELFSGSIDRTEVHPREVLRRALAHNAASVIVGHNHPSGNPEPSAADRRMTERLNHALKLLDIRLLDHFVIGDGTPVSLAARGWL